MSDIKIDRSNIGTVNQQGGFNIISQSMRKTEDELTEAQIIELLKVALRSAAGTELSEDQALEGAAKLERLQKASSGSQQGEALSSIAKWFNGLSPQNQERVNAIAQGVIDVTSISVPLSRPIADVIAKLLGIPIPEKK